MGDGRTDGHPPTPSPPRAAPRPFMKKLTSDEWAGLRPGHAPLGHLRRRGGGRGAHSGGGGRGVRELSQFPGSAAHRPAVPGCPVRHPLPGAASAGTSCLCCVPCPGEWALPAGGGRAGGHLRPSPFSRPCPLIPPQPPREAAGRRGAAGSGSGPAAGGGGSPAGGSGTGERLQEGVRFTFSRWKFH